MINKLKRKFIVLATVSMFLLMTVLVLVMNIVNYSSVVFESDNVLNMISQINEPFSGSKEPPDIPKEKIDKFIPKGMSPEVPYESRYFSVIITPTGEIKESNLSRIISVDEVSAKEYINKALSVNKNKGFINKFRFLKIEQDDTTKLLFLDCGRKLDSYLTFLYTSIAVSLCGCLIVFVIFLLVSGKIVKPINEAYEKQKRFISDAGHEIKTPLTIINANVDLLECDEEKEELFEIREQTKRLTNLTENLIHLSKLDEANNNITKVSLPFSDIINDEINRFKTLAGSKNLKLNTNITPNISITGSPNAVKELLSILLDNAIKYSSDSGNIDINMTTSKKSAILQITNPVKEKTDKENLSKVFDRFYRCDSSRNSETGGHGIGLSIAESIVSFHGGTISADTKTGFDFCITVNLPL